MILDVYVSVQGADLNKDPGIAYVCLYCQGFLVKHKEAPGPAVNLQAQGLLFR